MEEEKKKYPKTKVKCPQCEIKIDRNEEEFTEHSSRFYHKECYAKKFADTLARNNLIEYACKLQNLRVPTGYMLKQIKQFQEIHGYTTIGMLTTLKYVHEVEELPVMNGAGVGIIEYFYEKAVAYHTNLQKIKQKNSVIDTDNTEQVIFSTVINKKKKNKTISIEDI